MGKQADISAGAPGLRLTLLATSDLHANLRPYNYYTDSADGDPGLACVATLIERIRATEPNCLLFDNGDTLQGSPLGDLAAEGGLDGPHPMIAAMNALGYDAATLGNHDFNYGLAFLTAALADADFPVVLANLTRASGAPLLPPSVILDRDLTDGAGRTHRLRIGVMGLAPPQITRWDSIVLAGEVLSRPIVETARTEAARLRESGADLVVALCHSGQGAAEDAPDLENALVPLVRTGVADAIVAGHTHKVLPAQGTASEPVVQPGFFGSHLGRITLDLMRTGDRWQVAQARAEALPTRSGNGPLPPAPSLMRLSEDSHRATLAYARHTIGHCETPLETYFAMVTNSPALNLVAEAQAGFARQRLSGHPLAHLPILSAAAPFKGGGRAGPGYYTDIPAGPLSIRNAADLYAFPNTLRVLMATGADLADWLERAASGFAQIAPGSSGQRLIEPEFSAYNFDVIFGLSYQIDLAAAARFSADGEQVTPGHSRIRALCHLGQPVGPDDRFLVVTNSYRAAGGGHFPAPARCEPVLHLPVSARDVLVRHISAQSPLRPTAARTWRFAPLPGTSAVLETGPGALAHRDTIAALKLRPLGLSGEGFQRFEVPL